MTAREKEIVRVMAKQVMDGFENRDRNPEDANQYQSGFFDGVGWFLSVLHGEAYARELAQYGYRYARLLRARKGA